MTVRLGFGDSEATVRNAKGMRLSVLGMGTL